MRVVVALLFLALARYSSAQVIDKGPCPDVRPVDDFDVRRYAGRWYEIARFYTSDEEGLSCQTQNYTVNMVKEGYFLSNESGIGPNGKDYTYVFPMYNVSDWTTGNLYYAGEKPIEFLIPFVDYQRYSVNYACKEYFWGLINVQYAWIIARDRMMSEEDYDGIMKNVASIGIKVKNFIKADQRDCPVYRDRRLPGGKDEPEDEPEIAAEHIGADTRAKIDFREELEQLYSLILQERNK